ncbi:fimbrial protein [Buttiauxella ferragutiae]|jgi:major pilin subunit PapA|uniref:fimbrial protein n=1 Tax=Buttiauxella ferragutiae TaxID=82989 RepID=UPI001F534474|nr:fimbrial protein [Buttiauxella ferragutiae]UNK63553.1 type 1 fimbrial protein [Buttiauxella ferragutiae]
MSFKTTFTTLTSAVALSLVAFSAQAANGGEGVVNFTGSVINAACSIAPESADQTIDFGQISKTHLASGGISELRDIDILLTNCDPTSLVDKTVTVTFNGAAIPAAPTELGTTGNTGTAIIINSPASGDVVFGQPGNPQIIGDGNNTLRYASWVKMATGGAVAEGDFTAVTNFTLAYQ